MMAQVTQFLLPTWGPGMVFLAPGFGCSPALASPLGSESTAHSISPFLWRGGGGEICVKRLNSIEPRSFELY